MFKSRGIGLLTLGAAAGYAFYLRPRFLSWGTTPEELQKALPGDEFVPHPRYISTRAVTINARPEDVWPWLVQMGQGRGGLYSYSWLENVVGSDLHNAERILPEYQRLKVGDVVRLTPPERYNLSLVVAVIEPARALVLRTPAPPDGDRSKALEAGYPDGTWAFILEPVGERATRLIVRWRSDYKPTLLGLLVNQFGLEPVHFAMERKMLLGIKERAERAIQPALEPPGKLPDTQKPTKEAALAQS
jgi:hypothetical protein